MCLYIKNREVEMLAGEVATMVRETKTEAIRQALLNRRARLRGRSGTSLREGDLMRYLKNVWPFVVVVGAPTFVETHLVLTTKLRHDARPVVAVFLQVISAEVIPFGPAHLDAASAAFLRLGRGRHPAALNFGDRLSYALAAVSGLPLLFIGNEFGQTDLKRA